MKETARILVVGGGHVGMYTALRLQRKLRHQLKRTAQRQNQDGGTHGGVEIVVLDPEPYMTYQPFLPEAAAGSISPRHVVVPLRRVLTGCRLVIGKAVSIDHGKRVAHVNTLAAAEEGAGPVEISYTELALAPGSVSRTLPVPGLSEYGIGFKTVEEAIGLRNHVLEQLDIASSTRNPEVRAAALTFVFVGGGYAGVEALAELEDMARYACLHYHNVRAEDMKFLLVEATTRILPEVGEEMGTYALRELRARNIDVRLGTPRLLPGQDRRIERRLPAPHPNSRVDRGRQAPSRPEDGRTAPRRPRQGQMYGHAARRRTRPRMVRR
jgi:NADH:ubiquinone reductase (H+-translocating)